jgi:predicted DCC family thiol-disulfide oxidoreductase YuxK
VTWSERPAMVIGPREQVLGVPGSGGVLVFDGLCGFCTRAVYAVQRWDRRGRVRALPLQGPRVLELTGLTREEALREAWWIGADGARLRGAEAMTAALAAAAGIPLLQLFRVPGVRPLAVRVYRWVAAHRRMLRGVRPHCMRPTNRCDA